MRTQAIPSLDELLTQDRRFAGQRPQEPAEAPTEALNINDIAARYPELGAGGGQAPEPHYYDSENEFAEDEDNAAPTEAIDFSKLAQQFPELAGPGSVSPMTGGIADAARTPTRANTAPNPPVRGPLSSQGGGPGPMNPISSAPPPDMGPPPRPTPTPQQPPKDDDWGMGPTPDPAPRASTPGGKAPTPGGKAPTPAEPKKKSKTLLFVGIAAVVLLFCLCPTAIGGLYYGGFLTAFMPKPAPAPEAPEGVEEDKPSDEQPASDPE